MNVYHYKGANIRVVHGLHMPKAASGEPKLF